MEKKILRIQKKYVLRDYNNAELEYKMLLEVWCEAQKELLENWRLENSGFLRVAIDEEEKIFRRLLFGQLEKKRKQILMDRKGFLTNFREVFKKHLKTEEVKSKKKERIPNPFSLFLSIKKVFPEFSLELYDLFLEEKIKSFELGFSKGHKEIFLKLSQRFGARGTLLLFGDFKSKEDLKKNERVQKEERNKMKLLLDGFHLKGAVEKIEVYERSLK